ncbi:hypothetical protein BRAS3809_5950007 [Bradyrhizobium sp. STM 3809]|nr:hypothetical protein BRAS3809_5950007 [Bradyrhizobium sp. STM 3809]
MATSRAIFSTNGVRSRSGAGGMSRSDIASAIAEDGSLERPADGSGTGDADGDGKAGVISALSAALDPDVAKSRPALGEAI